MSAVFTLSSWQRLLVALAYAGVVAAAVWVIETPSVVPSSPVPAAPIDRAAIRVEATFAVGRWTVLVDGVAVEGTASAQGWSGSATGSEVLVQAERSDAADQSPGALRLWIGTRSVLAWGEGTVSVTSAIP